MESIKKFVCKGFHSLSAASRGEYQEHNEEIDKMRRDLILQDKSTSKQTDMKNLQSDWKCVKSDINTAYKKLTSQYE